MEPKGTIEELNFSAQDKYYRRTLAKSPLNQQFSETMFIIIIIIIIIIISINLVQRVACRFKGNHIGQ